MLQSSLGNWDFSLVTDFYGRRQEGSKLVGDLISIVTDFYGRQLEPLRDISHIVALAKIQGVEAEAFIDLATHQFDRWFA